MAVLLVELIQQSELAQLLRQSLWLYPVVNALHILGFALLLGTAITLDLRLLGMWSKTPLEGLVLILRPVMMAGLVLAVFFGVLLFINSAADYLNSSLFMTKMLLISVALINAFVLSQASYWRKALKEDILSLRIKLQALLSIILWIMVMFLGRFIGYR